MARTLDVRGGHLLGVRIGPPSVEEYLSILVVPLGVIVVSWVLEELDRE